MARVVTRRSSQPYLLVVFVFLFVIAAALAVVFHVKASRRSASIRLLEGTKTELQKEAAAYKGELEELATAITGVVGDGYDEAKQAVEDTFSNSDVIASTGGTKGGLAAELKKTAGLHQASLNTNNQQAAEIRSLQQTIQATNEKLAAISEEQDQRFGTLRQELDISAKSQVEQKSAYETHIAQTDALLKEKDQKFAEERKASDNKILTLVTELDVAENKNKSLQTKMAATPGLGTSISHVDGKILRTALNANKVYINLGSQNGLKPGVTFAVYSADQEEVIAKAAIQVTTVGDTWAEAKIVSQGENTDDPMVGDVISNLAYDPSRTYVFVVDGLFDIDHDGQVTARERQEVIDAIALFGGKVVPEIDDQVDYLVIGQKLTRPRELDASAPLAVQQTYNEAREAYEKFMGLTKAAMALGVEVFNANEFLELTGYMPETLPE